MKMPITLMVFLMISALVSGQDRDNKGVLDMAPSAGGFVKEIKFIPKQMEGTYYLHDYWSMGKVSLFNGDELENLQIKFDIEQNHLELKTENQIKLLEDSYIKEFTLHDTESGTEMKFLNCSLYQKDGIPLIGFFESLAEGNLSLFSKMELSIIKANYDPKFDVGDKMDKVVKVEKYYIARGYDVWEVTNNKKDNLRIFGDKADSMGSYLKSEKLSFKDEEDIKKMVAYYNQTI